LTRRERSSALTVAIPMSPVGPVTATVSGCGAMRSAYPIRVRVVLTDAASDAVSRVRAERGDDLALLIGNGCCDSTAPFLFSRYAPGPGEREVGSVAGVPVYLESALVDLFDGREVVIDVRSGGAAEEDSFSCETELGLRLTMERLPLPS
jgi:uncharacterized protein (DUF779 family)